MQSKPILVIRLKVTAYQIPSRVSQIGGHRCGLGPLLQLCPLDFSFLDPTESKRTICRSYLDHLVGVLHLRRFQINVSFYISRFEADTERRVVVTILIIATFPGNNCASSMGDVNPSDLLDFLEDILDSDPLIDEVGFIHPSQFAVLGEGAAGICSADGESEVSKAVLSDSIFLSADHKLGISTDVILLLYGAAKHAFMEATRQYKMLDLNKAYNMAESDGGSTCPSSPLSIAEAQLMKHSRALVLLSCDFGTAWNSRKVVLSKKQQIESFMDELLLSTLVLSVSSKSEHAWSHRRWAIKMVAGTCSNMEIIVERESKLVEKMAERSKMNYRAWNHRSWLASYMSVEQVLNELTSSRGLAGLHPADNSCFHYRCRLLLKLFDCALHGAYSDVHGVLELQELWKAELDWVGALIKRYVGREALWLHRRLLAFCWIKHFAKESCSPCITNIEKFMDQEIELFHLCSVVPDNSFEDYQAQAAFSTTYMIWITKQTYDTWGSGVQNKIDSIGLRRILNNVCPEKSFLWDALMAK